MLVRVIAVVFMLATLSAASCNIVRPSGRADVADTTAEAP